VIATRLEGEFRMHDRRKVAAIAFVSAILMYVIGTTTEIVAIKQLQPSEIELTWISDAILAAAFGAATFLWLNLKWTRLSLSRLERQHIIIEAQLALAADIQRGLLPRVPPVGDGVRWAARLQPAGRIGGDLYDLLPRSPRSWLVLVGDVSGKGVPAALVLASIRTMFRMIAAETPDPAEIATRMSRTLYSDHGGMPYLTCVVARIDLDRHLMVYVNAGHPAALVLRPVGGEDTRAVCDSTGPPVGLFPDQTYETASVALARGSVAVFVSDGITEAFDEIGVSSADPIGSAVAALPEPVDPERICTTLIERTAPALAEDGSGWQDDRTVVAFVVDQ
jgi:sigma-B regulation protein RsbU (phosphoserine phosphatase)